MFAPGSALLLFPRQEEVMRSTRIFLMRFETVAYRGLLPVHIVSGAYRRGRYHVSIHFG
jgi:hypothetical protein